MAKCDDRPSSTPGAGKVSNLNTISEDIVYFQPGTYSMPWNYQARLPSPVKWVYLAPGASISMESYGTTGMPGKAIPEAKR